MKKLWAHENCQQGKRGDVLVTIVLVEWTILKSISIFEFHCYCWPSWISNVILVISMLVTSIWWQFLNVSNQNFWSKKAEFVNVSNLSPINFVSNIGHQHVVQTNPFARFNIYSLRFDILSSFSTNFFSRFTFSICSFLNILIVQNLNL